MLLSTLAAIAMFAAPEATQSSGAEAKPAAEAKAVTRTCYMATPSGSRLARKVCVNTAPKPQPKAESAQAETPAATPKPE